MPLTLGNTIDRIREEHFAFPPAPDVELTAARARGVPKALLNFYACCDGAFVGDGDDFTDPKGRRYRVRIPRLANLQTTQSYGYIFGDSPLYETSSRWWQIVDYNDANWLAYDGSPECAGRIIDIFHETVGQEDYHNIVASSLTDLLDRMLRRDGVYWFDDDFQSLGSI